MDSPLLAAVLIVKDEEATLPRCLRSLDALRPLLSEIVVYDTGSSDLTVQVARDHGARVEQGYWDADFARARNDATALTGAKWVLSVDADEEVVADVPRLRALLRQGLTADLTGWDVVNVTVLDVDAHGAPLATHPFCKVFRPTRAEWASPIHETLVPARAGRRLVTVDAPQDVIHHVHHGYADAGRRRDKAERNAEVADLGLRAAEAGELPAPRRAKLLVDEGRALAAAGRSEEADACFRAAVSIPGLDPGLRRAVLVEAVSFFTLDRNFDDAERHLAELEALTGTSDATTWLRANLYLDSGRAVQALPLLRGLRTVRLSETVELDGSVAVATLLRAAVDAEEYDEALACAIQLVGSTGDVERYGRQLMRLWGDQPAHLLAELLGDIVGPRRASVADSLERLAAPAPAVAAALRRAHLTNRNGAGSAFRR